jgi:hypothetical protein
MYINVCWLMLTVDLVVSEHLGVISGGSLSLSHAIPCSIKKVNEEKLFANLLRLRPFSI